MSLRHPQQYYHSCMANRLSIERDEGFVVAHFGLLSRAGVLLDRLSCVFPHYILEAQKGNLVEYSDKIGTPKKKAPAWTPPPWTEDKGTLPVIDFLHVSYGDEHAEICFWSYSEGYVADLAASDAKEKVIAPWGIALLRCGLDLQREFLLGLYEDTI